MEQETFTLQVPYKGTIVPIEVKAVLIDEFGNEDYQVWINGAQAFTINPHLDVYDAPCWKLKEGQQGWADLEFVSDVGMEIERHYL